MPDLEADVRYTLQRLDPDLVPCRPLCSRPVAQAECGDCYAVHLLIELCRRHASYETIKDSIQQAHVRSQLQGQRPVIEVFDSEEPVDEADPLLDQSRPDYSEEP